MREPTLLTDLYAWHRAALAGLKPQITSEPQCGWFRRRLVPRYSNGVLNRNAPFVPCRIWLHQEIDAETGELAGPEELRCEVAGKPRDPIDEWAYLADSPITEAEYNFMVADAAYCREHHPSSPEANPTVSASSRSIPPLF